MTGAQRNIGVKRVYDEPAKADGRRVLVDRLWPRGLTKEDAQVDEWLRDLAPSNELRKWFHAHREKWAEFRKKYLQELRGPEAAGALAELHDLLSEGHHVTLLFASKNTDQNNAVVLKEVMEGGKKPPHTMRLAVQRARKNRRKG